MTKIYQPDMSETAVVRDQAQLLLGHLQLSRQLSERRLGESGERDPMASITGRSAIDAAIVTTRQMITHMDELLDELQRETEPAPALLVETSPAS